MDNAKNNTQKKVIISTAIGIVSMLIIIVGATYAYWNARGIVNFNTATITYETASKTLLTLNGTTGLLTLGTITSNDMSVYDTERIYYASADGKKTEPTEETIGEVRTPVGDLNNYRCNFTLALTHSGSADLIDRFLSETNGEPDYENRSEGQIILTVNGVEYDLNDGFPSTINGTMDVSDENPGQINVGMKFINLPNVNQIYLKNTNGAINITVTDFSCELKEWETVYLAPYFYINDAAPYHPDFGTMMGYRNGLTAVSDYHNISYTFLYDDDDSEGVDIFYATSFATLSECESTLNNPLFNLDRNSWLCELDNGEYKIIDSSYTDFLTYLIPQFEGMYDYGINVRYNQGMNEVFFYPATACQDALDVIQNDSNFIDGNGNSISSNNLSCVTIYPDVFAKETTIPIVADHDEWAIQYYYDTTFLSETECLISYYDISNTINSPLYYSYNGYPCVKTTNDRYMKKNLILKYDLAYYDPEYKTISEDPAKEYAFDIKKFSSESDCLDYLADLNDNSYFTINQAPTCVHIRELDQLYQVTKSELCMYENSNNTSLKCFDIEDDSFLDNFSSLVDELEDMGFSCNASTNSSAYIGYCDNNQYRIDFEKDYISGGRLYWTWLYIQGSTIVPYTPYHGYERVSHGYTYSPNAYIYIGN